MRTDNPYVGPRSLRDGDGLFGRDLERSNLRDLVLAQRVVLLYSPSGAGKSSLIEAGLRPDLRAKGFSVSPPLRLGRDDLSNSNRYVASLLSCLEEELDEDERMPPQSLESMGLVKYVGRRRQAEADRSHEGRAPPICLVLDQFEELFTLDEVDQAAKADLIGQVSALARDRTVWMVIAMREDFIARLDPYLADFPHELSRRFRLDFLDVAAAELAITRPAEIHGVTYTKDARRLLIDDLRTVKVKRGSEITPERGAYVQPVHLQVVCQWMWSRLDADINEITVETVQRDARIDDALQHFFDANIAEVAALQRVDEDDIRSWIQGSLITKNGFRGQADADSFKVARQADAVLQALEDHYILRSDSVRGVRMYELTHDRMVDPIRRSNERFAAAQAPTLPANEVDGPPVARRADAPIGVALAGRGMRAAVFGIGALLALIDSGLSRSTVSISSVSGGSLANGIAMTGPDLARSSPHEFELHLSPVLRAIAARGLFGRRVYAYLVVLTAVVTLAILSIFTAPDLTFLGPASFVGARLLIVIGAALLFVLLLRRRSALIQGEIDRELLGGSAVTMKELHARGHGVHHVIGTTEVQTREPFYVTNRVAYGFRFGAGAAAPDVPLSLVVQASLAEPGSFNPRFVALRKLGIEPSDGRGRLGEVLDSAVLVDGSLSDTMGTTWETQLANRARSDPMVARSQPDPASLLLVVHGSPRRQVESTPLTRSPGRPFRVFLRAQSVAAEHVASLQRQLLVSQSRAGSGREAVLVQIDDSPYRLPTVLGPGVGHADDAVVARAEEALRFLERYGKAQATWESLVASNSRTVTGLTRLGVQRTAELLEHGYILTLVNLYVVDGRSTLLDVDQSRFQRLAEGL